MSNKQKNRFAEEREEVREKLRKRGLLPLPDGVLEVRDGLSGDFELPYSSPPERFVKPWHDPDKRLRK